MVRNKQDKQIYAMKVLMKSAVIALKHVSDGCRERMRGQQWVLSAQGRAVMGHHEECCHPYFNINTALSPSGGVISRQSLNL